MRYSLVTVTSPDGERYDELRERKDGQWTLYYLEVEAASGFGIAPLLKREVEAALAKNPNPAGHPAAEPSAHESGALAGEGSGPVGLGPTEARHEIGRLPADVERLGVAAESVIFHFGIKDEYGSDCVAALIELQEAAGADSLHPPEKGHAVGPGFVAVPVEPTPEMLREATNSVRQFSADRAATVYSAMLRAAPTTILSQGRDEGGGRG